MNLSVFLVFWIVIPLSFIKATYAAPLDINFNVAESIESVSQTITNSLSDFIKDMYKNNKQAFWIASAATFVLIIFVCCKMFKEILQHSYRIKYLEDHCS
ncbi:CLUMA_CG016681, isoform A [Clunio marinus]|uniref:CLUMA_CG016681, isoform A n=1 Tax=Clunio marinus TaxID=568069 RepID=A0A1J1IUN3_9DIPT|nr:CLUMA_CG016681, isoform A [Clunio marinus]